jgi:hypothetical protein
VLTVRAFDYGGNASITTVTINVSNVDTVPPSITITGPAEGATVSGWISTEAIAADDVGLQKVRFSTDSSYLGYDSSAPYAIDLDTTTLSNGSHQISARAIDYANNSSTFVVNIIVDN